MRYTCPKCKRAFHLETHMPTPCPGCGVMLRRDAAPVTGGTFGEVDAGTPLAAKQEDPGILDEPVEHRPVATAFATPQLPGGRDTGRTKLDPATQEKAAKTKPSKLEPTQTHRESEVARPAGLVQRESGSFRRGESGPGGTTPTDRSRFRQQESRNARPFAGSPKDRARRGDLPGVHVAAAASPRMRTFAIQGAAAGALAALVIAVVLTWRPAAPSSPARPPETTQIDRANRRVAELEGELSRLQEKNSSLADSYKRVLTENRGLVEQMDGHRRDLHSLKESMRRRAEATGLVVGAVKLIERRSGLERALGMVTAALEQDPTLADAHRVKGLALAALGRPDEALKALDAAHEAARAAGLPGDFEAVVLAGEICLTDLDSRDRARAYYAKALGLKGDAPLILAAEARLLFIEGDLDRAVTKAREAKKADGILALAPLILGEIAFKRSLLASGAERARLLGDAGSLLGEAVKLDPNSARACLMRGRVLLDESRLAERTARLGLLRFDRTARADRLLSRANGLSPRLPGAYVALADLRLTGGVFRDPAKARDFAQEAVRLTERKNANALATLAAAQAATGDPVNATRTIEEALRADPENERLRSALREYEQSARALTP